MISDSLVFFRSVKERIICRRITDNTNRYQILPVNQSGFRNDCTIALRNVTDDIVRAADAGNMTALVLLDFPGVLTCNLINYLEHCNAHLYANISLRPENKY